MIKCNNNQQGAVSLFIVIFAALLMTVVTVSFVGIMVQHQQQSTATDLSQSAFDSAQAGVEDAKRAILRYQSVCTTGAAADCTAARSMVNLTTCNEAVRTLTDVGQTGDEIKVQTNVSNALDQAYTCVKIYTLTDDYLGELEQDSSTVIPLIGVSAFDTIKIEWFNANDLQNSTNAYIPPFASGKPLPLPLLHQDIWTSSEQPNRPSIMRSQLIQFDNDGFILGNFNDDGNPNGSNNTLFLYPSNIVESQKAFTNNHRRTYSFDTPKQVTCQTDLSAGGYACSATIKLPTASDNHTQYLNLTSIYKKANYRITLLNGLTPVKLDGVQPLIDSTGRVNDIFRRVQTRVELTDVNFPYPEAAIDIRGDFCKTFFVTNSTDDYSDGGCE